MINKLFQRHNTNKFAVNEIFGTILLLGISVSLFSIVYISVLTMPHSTPTNSTDIYFSYNGTKIILTHSGGKELNVNTQIKIKIDSYIANFCFGCFGNSSGSGATVSYCGIFLCELR